MTRIFTAALLLLSLIAAPAHADFAAGAKAYDGGDYATAFAEWGALARQDDPAAQVALAGMLRAGNGRAVDLTRAPHWYRRAADAGNAVAQMNLGEMYQQGWGIKRDPIKALIWYERAAVQGNDWAIARRDALAKTMTADQRETARSLLRN